MKIADLFVNLGIKGDGPAQKALTSVKSTIGEISSVSLAAKAAIVGLVYGLEQLMSASAGVGTGLMNFNSLTGLSTKSLQEWQYAARQVGVSGDEMESSIKAVQTTMTNMLLGQAPEGMAMVSSFLGKKGTEDLMKHARDTFYVFQQLQKVAQGLPPDIGNKIIKSFGPSEGVIAGFRRNAFRPEVFKNAPSYNEKEISSLNKVDVAWSNLGNKIKMAIGHFTAKDGLKIVADIDRMTTSILHLVEALIVLAEKLKIFKIVGTLFDFLAGATDSANKQVGAIAKPDSYKSKNEPGKTGYGQMWKDAVTNDFGKLKEFLSSAGEDISSNIQNAKNQNPISLNVMAPPASTQTSNATNNSTTVNQNLNFQHDGKDHQQVKDTHRKAAHNAYRLNPAQAGGY